tara:strand:- start:64 stop:597 length:534 start_codon:yes stop_codon:yes gene_type:complete
MVMKMSINLDTKKLIIICATILLVGVLFWPTLYRYEKVTGVRGGSFPIKINRLTGYTEAFVGGKWEPEVGQEEKKAIFPLPDIEKRKITGNASFGLYESSFKGKIYNGTDWTIMKLIVKIVAKEADGSVRWDRNFEERTHILPLSTKSLYFSVTGAEGVASHQWSIEEAFGYKSNNN